jgi:hypothetical protein
MPCGTAKENADDGQRDEAEQHQHEGAQDRFALVLEGAIELK